MLVAVTVAAAAIFSVICIVVETVAAVVLSSTVAVHSSFEGVTSGSEPVWRPVSARSVSLFTIKSLSIRFCFVGCTDLYKDSSHTG